MKKIFMVDRLGIVDKKSCITFIKREYKDCLLYEYDLVQNLLDDSIFDVDDENDIIEVLKDIKNNVSIEDIKESISDFKENM